jgi:polysaccharide deacetylase family protein (PEP-CTERM system associated)
VAHALSIDVEDWYHGIEIPMHRWGGFERRIGCSMGALLDLMAEEGGVRATCFVLGKVAEEHPQLVKDIHAAGHEVATHGYSHEKVYDLGPVRFRRELRRSVGLLEDLTGERVLGHRAPFFSITEDALWALRILREEGLRYDSSIHPVLNYRYGIAGAERRPARRPAGAGHSILELPVSTFPTPLANVPVGGGAYFRLYPYALTRFLLRRLAERGESLSFYVHPWELDPDHPRTDEVAWLAGLTHYANLRSTRPKLRRLFRDFRFAPYREVFADRLTEEAAPPEQARSPESQAPEEKRA